MGGVVTGHTVLHSACVEGSKLCAKVVLGGGVRVGGGSHWAHGPTQRLCRGQQTVRQGRTRGRCDGGGGGVVTDHTVLHSAYTAPVSRAANSVPRSY